MLVPNLWSISLLHGKSIAINPDKFGKLITAVRTAIDNDGALDKEATSYDDIFDAFRLALKFYSAIDLILEWDHWSAIVLYMIQILILKYWYRNPSFSLGQRNRYMFLQPL